MTNSRRKGIGGELEAAKLWRRWFPDCRRSFGQARDGYEQPDLIGGVEKDFYVEVKRYAKITPRAIERWLDKLLRDWVAWQKECDPPDHTNPILMWRTNGSRVWNVVCEGVWVFGDGREQKRWVEYPWSDFAAAMDKIYPVKEDT